MKKIILTVMLFILTLPTIVNASTQALNLYDSLVASGIEPTNEEDRYKESDDQIIVYLFRSPSCEHCHDALMYFDSLIKEHGNKFKLRSYDVLNNKDNRSLQTRITNFLKIDAPNVPLIIIGKNAIYGFGDSSKEKIVSSIENEYNAKEKYDVIEEMNKEKSASKKPSYIIAGILIVGVIVFILIFVKKS